MSETDHYRALLEVSKAILAHKDLTALFHQLSLSLPPLLKLGFVDLALHEPARQVMRAYTIATPEGINVPQGLELPVDEAPGGWVWKTQQSLVIHDLTAEARFPRTVQMMRSVGVQSFCVLPLTTSLRRIGGMGFGRLQSIPFDGGHLHFLQQVANQVAAAVDHVLNYESAEAAQQGLAGERDRLRLLLEINNAVVSHLGLRGLLKGISVCLQRVIPHDAALLTLHEPESDQLRLHALDLQMFGQVPFEEGVLISVGDTPEGQAITSRRPVLVGPKVDLSRFSSPWVRHAVENGVRSGCAVPLIFDGRTLGALSVVSSREDAFTVPDAELLTQCGNQIAIAVENALNFERAQQAERKMWRQYERERLMLEINNAVVSHLELPELLKALSACLRRVIQHDFAGIALYDHDSHRLIAHALDFPLNQDFVGVGDSIPIDGTPEGLALTTRQPVLIKKLGLKEFPAEIVKRGVSEGLRSGCAVPLISRGKTLGTLSVVSVHESAFSQDDADLFARIAAQVAIAIENGLAYREIANLKDKLNNEKLYLEDEIRSDFEEIIGESTAIKQVLKQVGIVAPTDSTVLILGETGTGKELLARAIHDRSKRREGTFVKLNCAAIPMGLLESELFGHEKGAFTGAIVTKIGRFELADGGTLFLDEVGDIPVELQSKLLRVLQEQEFERLGGTRTIKVKVRLVAATNRDLLEMVEKNLFRGDLYYRLNVFPIVSPALRERAGDIPLLVRYFTQRLSRRMEKRIERIPSDTMETLCRYRWPGNVRELENLIERAVILSQGTELNVPLGELKIAARESPAPITTLQAAEREHILRALKEANWVIAGPSGAAAMLGMKRSTLQSKMIKLGISRRFS